MELSPTARLAIAAYGGEALWRDARSIEAVVSARGLAFAMKRRPTFDRAPIRMEIHAPRSQLTGIGRDRTVVGVLDGANVRLEAAEGSIVAARAGARGGFARPRRMLFWDDMDMAYFANYAFWNYFTLPNLLMNPAIAWTELSPGRLRAKFPDSIPTHSPVQEFHFDPNSGLLRQHDYTAEIISRRATAANVVLEHSRSDGIAFASSQLVSPRMFSGRALGWPRLIENSRSRVQDRAALRSATARPAGDGTAAGDDRLPGFRSSIGWVRLRGESLEVARATPAMPRDPQA